MMQIFKGPTPAARIIGQVSGQTLTSAVEAGGDAGRKRGRAGPPHHIDESGLQPRIITFINMLTSGGN